MGEESMVGQVPREIRATLAHRKFTLVGFGAREAYLLAKAFEEMKALSHGVNPLEAWPGSKGVKDSDLVILNLTGGLQGSHWIDGRALARNPNLLLLVGYQSEVYKNPALDSAAQDVLIRPFDTAELLMRSSRLLSRSRGRRNVPGSNGESARVMLADDDPSITNLLTALLQNHHIECTVAANGEAALQGARRQMPDLVVLDVDMPRMNGFEVLATLRKEPGTHALKVILLTGNQDEEAIAKGSALGADDYIVKPFSPGDLLGRVKKLLSPLISPPPERSLKVFVG